MHNEDPTVLTQIAVDVAALRAAVEVRLDGVERGQQDLEPRVRLIETKLARYVGAAGTVGAMVGVLAGGGIQALL